MAGIDYQGLLNAINNLPGNATEVQKKNVLTTVSDALINGNEPDARLLLRAIGTRASLQYAGANVNMAGWIQAELDHYKRDLDEKIVQPPAVVEDEEMALGGRKRRKSRKGKKTRRYTRRR